MSSSACDARWTPGEGGGNLKYIKVVEQCVRLATVRDRAQIFSISVSFAKGSCSIRAVLTGKNIGRHDFGTGPRAHWHRYPFFAALSAPSPSSKAFVFSNWSSRARRRPRSAAAQTQDLSIIKIQISSAPLHAAHRPGRHDRSDLYAFAAGRGQPFTVTCTVCALPEVAPLSSATIMSKLATGLSRRHA